MSGRGMSIPRPAHSIHALPFDEHVVLVDTAHSRLMLLNPTAGLVWEWLQQGCDTQTVVRRLCDSFDIARELAQADTAALLDDWCARGLMDSAGKGSPAGRNARVGQLPFDVPSPQPLVVADEHTYMLTDIPFRVRFHTAVFADRIHPLLAHLETCKDTPGPVFDLSAAQHDYLLSKDGCQLLRDQDPVHVTGELFHQAVHLSYPDLRELVTLHAGAVSQGGRAVVLPAVSGSGKSTLVAELIAHGLEYQGDDVVPLSLAERRLAPLPTALSIKSGSWPLLVGKYPQLAALPEHHRFGRRMRFLAPRTVPGSRGIRPQVHCLVFPRYSASGTGELVSLTPSEALARLIKAQFWLGHPLSVQRVDLLLGWLRDTPSYHLEYSASEEAISQIRGLF